MKGTATGDPEKPQFEVFPLAFDCEDRGYSARTPSDPSRAGGNRQFYKHSPAILYWDIARGTKNQKLVGTTIVCCSEAPEHFRADTVS
jgi:hypothetical protein